MTDKVNIALLLGDPSGIGPELISKLLPNKELDEANILVIGERIKSDHNTGGPARYFTSFKLSNKIGFISPLTNNFCATCNRVRISSTGKLFMCLGQNDYVDFREIMRKDYSDDFIKEKIRFALNIKPKNHDFMIGAKINKYMKRHMNVTGG